MNFPENQELRKLIQQFHINTQIRFSGRLDIKSSQGQNWSLYYQFGQLVWATGGTHPNRRWMRNIREICPSLDLKKVKFDEPITSADYWDYLLLLKLQKDGSIQSEQVYKFVVSCLKEVFFEIYQQINYSSLTFERDSEKVLEIQTIPTSSRSLLRQVKEDWNNWVKSGLANISPSLATVLMKPENLRQEVSPVVFQNLSRLINGKSTLYELSINMKQDILDITRSLLPYITKGIIELRKVPDLPLASNQLSLNYTTNFTSSGKLPLIACVDDSIHFCKLLNKIITSHGMNFIGIHDSIQALPNLIESKPDLIFLDLVMPIINGYELCSQLRCSSIFANTPIIILTSSNGIFDQAKAKAFGATDFLNKYITRDNLLESINKHLLFEVPDHQKQLVGVS
jgi:chemotaxis family two-component system response regulator PixG